MLKAHLHVSETVEVVNVSAGLLARGADKHKSRGVGQRDGLTRLAAVGTTVL